MNREIKFRGYSKDLQRWYYGYYYGGFDWACFIIADHGFEMRQQVVPESVGQYTGLKDKNGTEIYEGDILRDEQGIGVVYFYPPQFVVQTQEDVPFALAKGKVNVRQLDCTEVIGNIYQNKNLIEP